MRSFDACCSAELEGFGSPGRLPTGVLPYFTSTIDRELQRPLTYGEPLGISFKEERFTCDQSNLQEISIAFVDLSGNPVNQRMTFQASFPDGREILPPSHHMRALTCEIDRSFVAHINSLDCY
jgi:hypothetical protein